MDDFSASLGTKKDTGNGFYPDIIYLQTNQSRLSALFKTTGVKN